MKKVSEGTSSSASGRHYSLYKALHSFPFTMSIMVKLVNTCVQNNILLQRWLKVVQVMLCKCAGNYNIEKLRVIQLIEADLNMYFRLIWGKRLVQHIIQRGHFLLEQFGGSKVAGLEKKSLTIPSAQALHE